MKIAACIAHIYLVGIVQSLCRINELNESRLAGIIRSSHLSLVAE
jgi:hypothetical protein